MKSVEDQQEVLLLYLKILQVGEAKAESVVVRQAEETERVAF
jgi:hypothetical protein